MTTTAKQEVFCLSYLETGNASEAYRRAYDASQMKPATINRKAKDLLDNGKITARLAELRRPAILAAQVTYESHLEKLAELRDLALANGAYAAAITAEVNRGKIAGLYVDQKNIHIGYCLEDALRDLDDSEVR